ncbi:MAG TPA: hypothetical protein VIQ24_20885 [Pyrinomonadaceae bacterium]
MKFKSPALERTMTRLSQSIAGGILIPTLLFLAFTQTAGADSEVPLPETNPFFYLLSLPFLFWKYVLPDAAYLATGVSNIVIYSLLTYCFIRYRANQKRLP